MEPLLKYICGSCNCTLEAPESVIEDMAVVYCPSDRCKKKKRRMLLVEGQEFTGVLDEIPDALLDRSISEEAIRADALHFALKFHEGQPLTFVRLEETLSKFENYIKHGRLSNS